jgi:hypothetical protein
MTPTPRGKRRQIVAHGSAWVLRQYPGGPLRVLQPCSYNGRELPGVHVMSSEGELRAALLTMLWPNGKPAAKAEKFEMQD